jgi:endothelin-converting enzyme/putative endopeptidase
VAAGALIAWIAAAGAIGCSYDARPTASAITQAQGQELLAPPPVDASVDPCEDFYAYACNQWLTAHPPEPTRPMVGRGLPAVHERSRVWLWQHLSAGRAGTDGGLATFYAACMDEDAIAARGTADLAPLLAAIDAGSDPAALLHAAGVLHRAGVPALFDVRVVWDGSGSEDAVLRIGPTELPAPAHAGDDRDGRQRSRRYATYIADMLAQIGDGTDAAVASVRALRVERQLAAAAPRSRTAPDPLGVSGAPLPIDLFDLRLAPLPFVFYLAAAGFARPTGVVVSDTDYLDTVRALVTDQGEAVQDYLRWALARAAAPHLPDAHGFHYGLARPMLFNRGPRWQQCVELAEQALPDEIAALYEEQAAGAATRAAVLATSEAIQRAAVRRLEQAAWLDPPSRAAAADKVGRMQVQVGHPPGSAPPLVLRGDAHLANLIATSQRQFARMAAQVTAGFDPSVGLAPSSTANAFYRPLANDVVVPLTLAQPPFFSVDQSPALNFAGLGAVVGHEVGHAFDRTGRRVDAAGALREWAASSQEAVRARETCLGERLAQHEAAPRHAPTGLSNYAMAAKTVDAERTADEHLADVAGLTFAHDAYREHATQTGAAADAAGATDDRAFFLAYAQLWCTNLHPVLAHGLANVDVHVPAQARVNAALAQVPAFAEAYQCAPGAALRPAQTCDLW